MREVVFVLFVAFSQHKPFDFANRRLKFVVCFFVQSEMQCSENGGVAVLESLSRNAPVSTVSGFFAVVEFIVSFAVTHHSSDYGAF